MTSPLGSSLGAIGAALPTLRIDAPLQNHRWNILCQDLPVLDPTCSTDQVGHLVQALRDEQAATRLAEVEARSHASAPKTPSATFLQTAARWRTYCLAVGDDGLPPPYTTYGTTQPRPSAKWPCNPHWKNESTPVWPQTR